MIGVHGASYEDESLSSSSAKLGAASQALQEWGRNKVWQARGFPRVGPKQGAARQGPSKSGAETRCGTPGSPRVGGKQGAASQASGAE